MKPGRTTLPAALIRLPRKFLTAFFGATFATRPLSIRTEWPCRTLEVFPKVSTVPFSMSRRSGMRSTFAQRGQFLRRAVVHEDGTGKTFLRAQRAARAVAAMLAERSDDLRELLRR